MQYILCKETYILYKTIQNLRGLASVSHTGLCHWFPKVSVKTGRWTEAGNNGTRWMDKTAASTTDAQTTLIKTFILESKGNKYTVLDLHIWRPRQASPGSPLFYIHYIQYKQKQELI